MLAVIGKARMRRRGRPGVDILAFVDAAADFNMSGGHTVVWLTRKFLQDTNER